MFVARVKSYSRDWLKVGTERYFWTQLWWIPAMESQKTEVPTSTIQKVSRLVGSGSKLEESVRICQKHERHLLKDVQTVPFQSFVPNRSNTSSRSDSYHGDSEEGTCGDRKLKGVGPDHSFQAPQSGVKDADAAHHRSDVMDVESGGCGKRQGW
jgi:hypothetical protein